MELKELLRAIAAAGMCGIPLTVMQAAPGADISQSARECIGRNCSRALITELAHLTHPDEPPPKAPVPATAGRPVPTITASLSGSYYVPPPFKFVVPKKA